MFVRFDVPPGIYRQGTAYQAQGRFYDADLIRFYEGTIRPVGGWLEQSSSAVSGKARAITTWLSNANVAWTGIGTHTGLYAMSRNGTVSDITPAGFVAGSADASVGGGYGTSSYGSSFYGTPRLSDTNIIPATVWTLDTFGELLLGTAGDTIYEWDLDVGAPATAVTDAPTAEAVLVTDERIVMALGADGDPRAVAWSDAEDRNEWTPASTNLAGGKRLQTNGKLRCGRRVRGGLLIFTDVDVHVASYIGLPLVYGFERLATGCGIAAKGAVAVVDDRAYWMGVNGFWAFNGYVDVLPCEVADYVFGDINRTQISKVSAWHNSLFGEVWWHYPSAASDENDRYVVFNYREGHWSIGGIVRLSGADRGVLPSPVLMGDDGFVYRHEIGQERAGRQPYLTSGPMEIGEGDTTLEVHGIIPDERTLGDVTVAFSVGDYPNSPSSTVASVPAAAKTDVRFSARRVAAQMVAVADQDFRIGAFRFDVKQGSGR